jgi:hypothetical protein
MTTVAAGIPPSGLAAKNRVNLWRRDERRTAAKGKLEGEKEILTREQVLQILSEQARNGSITAAVHLERALRLGGGPRMTMRTTFGPSSTRLGRLVSRDDD